MKSWLAKEQAQFSQHITANNLPHAILISGVKGSGKRELATWLIHVLQCNNLLSGELLQPCFQCKNCNLLSKKSYPDHLQVSSDKASLGVDNIRQASLFFEKTAQIGRIKTVLIPDAETMTIAAANALLKTLEEPTANSVIILLSNERDTLLPTIISRCRLFEIRPPSGELLLKELETSSITSGPFVNLSQLPELSNADIANEYSSFESEYLSYLNTKQGKSSFIKTVSSSAYGLRWLEKITINLMRTNQGWLNTANLNENSLLSIKSDTLWKIYNKITTTITTIKTLSQANSQFLIEKLIIDIDQMLMNE
jgi:DNA polymerase-3 subunit delta'